MSSGKKKVSQGTSVPLQHLGHELGPLVRVVVLVSELGEEMNPLKGMMEFFDNAGAFFTGGVHQKGTMKAWCTHFALMLHFQSGTTVRVERDTEGVRARKGCENEASEFEGRSWDGCIEDLDPLRDFLLEQSRRPYNGIDKNCKHFVYDFFVHVLGHDSRDPFNAFCTWTEANYRRGVKRRRGD
mmetsp:Transcript_64234/g.129032  ORF Transcript_64234/g.129032 Transcript_64234/m.129032 type:complete len:184 (-) Transcript_64234:159-710(-)